MFENTVWQTLHICDETHKENNVSLKTQCIN